MKFLNKMKIENLFFIFAVIFILIFCVVFFSGFVSADVLSLNSGGSDNLVVNPDNYIEGFFSGLPPSPPVCGNGVIETGEQCDDGNTVSGDGCSSTCQIEGEPPGPGPEPPGPTGPTVIPTLFEFSPSEINLNLLTNTNREQLIVISSNANYTINVTLGQSNLDHMLILTETQVTLQPGEVKEIRAIFVALNQTGIFTGKIYVGNKVLPVTLNIKTKLLLFDSNIIVLNKDYLVRQGDKLRTSVTLIPMGDPERLDVTLNYVIKDYDGRLYLTRSETVLVEEQVNFKRNFDTGILPLGEYIIGLELIYPNGVAPSSAHFEVIERGPTTLFGKIVYFILNGILIILILLIIVVIIRLFKRIKENKEYEEKYGKIPKKERKTLFYSKGKAKPLPTTKKDTEITGKSKKEGKEIKESKGAKATESKSTTPSSSGSSSSKPVNIGSFSFKKGGKKT
jgi:cysteine-rich repeat protein